MKRSKILLITLSLIVFALGQAGMARADTQSLAGFGASDGVGLTRPLTLFGSIGSGVGMVTGSDYSETPVGPHAILGGSASIQLPRWEIDGGASWFFSSVSGRVNDGSPVRVRTRVGSVDLGARYRLGSRWQVGPALNFAFGADTGFGPSVGNASIEPLVGVKAVYELPISQIPVRLWSQLSSTVSPGSHLLVALAGLQVGVPVSLPWQGGKASRKPADVIVVSAAAAEPPNEVRVVLDGQKIFFGTASTQLRPEIVQALRNVGSYLNETAGRFGQVRVDGHADQRGPFEMNLKLSRSRARAVGEALRSGGIESEAVAIEGFSYLKPLDPLNSRPAWAKNRRVELVFEDVQDPAGLREALKPLASESPRDKR